MLSDYASVLLADRVGSVERIVGLAQLSAGFALLENLIEDMLAQAGEDCKTEEGLKIPQKNACCGLYSSVRLSAGRESCLWHCYLCLLRDLPDTAAP